MEEKEGRKGGMEGGGLELRRENNRKPPKIKKSKKGGAELSDTDSFVYSVVSLVGRVSSDGVNIT